jgi:hypothetical protein
MISILRVIQELQTGKEIKLTGSGQDYVAKEGTAKGDKVQAAVEDNRFTKGGEDGQIKGAPNNPDVAYRYLNTPLARITKTRL